MFEVLRLYTAQIHIIETISNTADTKDFPGLHLDPDVYRNINLSAGEKGSGSDELDFRPTRWLSGSQQTFFQPPKGSFLPYSAGAFHHIMSDHIRPPV
ncbi:hypothetical protein LTR78_000271 [Recurvomyces mirabilis]|uniref:Uncharacterized protein n=1 Tax=Recurvomyces mirabilis TaxID=574656 RepID=A0AAE1C6E8_9PEZI|nr:hypothetical protein LTR78_000271 [Recurvomyces mirabilis]KAK5161926.1 hypothetical protein LTS14_000272 [Recurvomyces mirabilis]